MIGLTTAREGTQNAVPGGESWSPNGVQRTEKGLLESSGVQSRCA